MPGLRLLIIKLPIESVRAPVVVPSTCMAVSVIALPDKVSLTFPRMLAAWLYADNEEEKQKAIIIMAGRKTALLKAPILGIKG